MANRDPQDASSSQPGHEYRQVYVNDSARAHLGDTYNIGNYHAGLAIASDPSSSPFRNKHFEVPRSPSAFFTGREDVLELLETRCLPSSSANSKRQQKRFVIHGLGGSGKSQLCLKFTEDHREEFWGIFWVDASSPESLERGFRNIADVCKLESNVKVVKRWLSNTTEPWIMILDNADDPCLDISRYFPAGNRGIILITTRNPECKVHGTAGSYELGAMTTDEAITLILKTAGVKNTSDTSIRRTAKPVVATLGCLALAIIQAGAVIQNRLCSMEEYCGVYSHRRQELLSQRAVQGEDEYPYTVHTTWEVSREKVEQMSSQAGRDAIELLNIFSFLHYDGISEELFHRAWKAVWSGCSSGYMLQYQTDIVLRQRGPEWDVWPLRRAVSLLVSFSLINRDKDNLISIHPLVHTWVRDRLSSSENFKLWVQTASTLAMSVPQTNEIVDYRFRWSLVPHIDACLFDGNRRTAGAFRLPHVGQDLPAMVASFIQIYHEAGQQQVAFSLAAEAMEISRETLGEEHGGTLRSMSNFAVQLNIRGRQEEALQLLEKVVEMKQKNLGEEHDETLTALHDLARHFSEMGQSEKAIRLLEQVVEVGKRILGEKHFNILASMHNLAICYRRVDRQKEALELAERVVKMRRRTLGDENPETLSSMMLLANVYSEIDREEESMLLTERVVDGYKRTLGEEHPETLGAIYTLVNGYGLLRRLEEAMLLAEPLVETYKRTLGATHPATTRSLDIYYQMVFNPRIVTVEVEGDSGDSSVDGTSEDSWTDETFEGSCMDEASEGSCMDEASESSSIHETCG